jgi:hypothetical protein
MDANDPNNIENIDGMSALPDNNAELPNLNDLMKKEDDEQPASGKPDELSESDAYWKAQYDLVLKETESARRYNGLIEAMQDDAGMVQVLERYLAGDTGKNETVQGEDIDLGDTYIEGSEKPRDSRPQRSEAEVREDGARLERAKIEAQAFEKNLMESGVPDHVVHEFNQWVRNPSDATLADLYSAFSHRQERNGKPLTDPVKKSDETLQQEADATRKMASEMPPMPMGSGTEDRPDSGTYTDIGAGHNFEPNANDI